MKITLVLCLLACAVSVYAENCTVNNDCAGTVCAQSFHIICEHPDKDNGITSGGGLCTCAKDDLSCQARDDCLQLASFDCNSDRRIHCYDNKCICSRW